MDHVDENMLQKILAIGFGFFAVMILSYFTAITTAKLSFLQKKSNIISLRDIRDYDKLIGAPENYLGVLRSQFGISQIVTYNSQNVTDMKRMIDLLSKGDINAVLIDRLIARYYASKYCYMNVLPDTLVLAYQPVFFKEFVDKSIIHNFNVKLISVLDSSRFLTLQQQYINIGESLNCDATLIPQSLKTKDLIGLFLFSFVIGTSCLVFAMFRFYRIKWFHHKTINTTSSTIEHETASISSETEKNQNCSPIRRSINGFHFKDDIDTWKNKRQDLEMIMSSSQMLN